VSTPRIHVETIPIEARSFQGEAAGLVTRVAANIIDVAVVVLGLVTVYLGVAGVMFLRQGARFTFPIVTYRAAVVAGFVALVMYFTVSWAAAPLSLDVVVTGRHSSGPGSTYRGRS